MNHRELAAALEAGTLDPAEFDHAAHVRLAWYYLESEALPAAALRLSGCLRDYTAALGVPGKYHETITLGWLFLIASRRRAANRPGWRAFRRDNPDLFEPGSRALERHYRPATLRAPVARRAFLFPDRLPLPVGPSCSADQRGHEEEADGGQPQDAADRVEPTPALQ